MILLEVIKVGDKLGKDSKVLRIIGGPGQTGMGIVYICYSSLWKSIVAVKTFQNRFFSSVDVFNSFKLEALAWIKLNIHPHIVNAIAVQDINGRPFIYMEYIAPDKLGRNTLTHYLRSPISLKKALKWGIQFCHAMEHTISHGVSPHRDIKPDNIMITNTQDLKVTDFGLAKLWNKSNFLDVQSQTTHEDLSVEKINKLSLFKGLNNNNIVGTPPWMAPEQFEGVADIRSDIYSFGLVLYQMMNHGKLPFIANTIEGFKEAHQKHPLPQFESVLFPIVEKCLAKSPKDRYFNFKDIRLALEELYKKETGDDIQLIKVIPHESIKHAAKGYSFIQLGLYDEAMQELEKSLTYDKDDLSVLNNLGLAYSNKKMFDKARDIFKRIITLSPDTEEYYINIASLYIHKAHFMKDPAIMYNTKKYLDKVLELNPNNTGALQNLATYYSEFDNDQNKAIKILERCLELDPNNPTIYRSLACDYERLGMRDKVFEMLKKTIQLNPASEIGWSSLGYLYYSQGRYDQALPIYKKLMSINPNEPAYRKNVENIKEDLSNKNKEPNQEISSFQKKNRKKNKESKTKKTKI